MSNKTITFLPLAIFATIAIVMLIKLAEINNAGEGRDFLKSNLIGKPVPEFALTMPGENTSFSSKELEGSYYIINIFASWCVSCVAEHKILKKFSINNSIPIYGIAWKDNIDNLRRWLGIHGNPYKNIGFDSEGRVAIEFGISGVPETFLIDDKGIIIANIKAPLTEDIIESEIVSKVK